MYKRQNDGCFISVFNVSAFRDLQDFKDEVTEFAAYLKSSETAPGFDEVLYPGEIEYRNETRQRKEGIFVEDSTWGELQSLAEGYNIASELPF